MWKYSSQKMMFWGVHSRKVRIGRVFCRKWVATAGVDKQEPRVACVLAWGGVCGVCVPQKYSPLSHPCLPWLCGMCRLCSKLISVKCGLNNLNLRLQGLQVVTSP